MRQTAEGGSLKVHGK